MHSIIANYWKDYNLIVLVSLFDYSIELRDLLLFGATQILIFHVNDGEEKSLFWYNFA